MTNLVKDITEEIFAFEATKSPRLYLYEYDEIEEIVWLTIRKLKEKGVLPRGSE